MSTVDLQSENVTPQEWEKYHRKKYDMALDERKISGEISRQSKDLIKATDAITDHFQEESTKQLKGRVHDILFWKIELEKGIHDMITENDLLLKEKRRLENALLESEIPFSICTENLNTRGQRCGIDHVVDEVDGKILTEMDVIHSVQDVLKETIKQAERQVGQNHGVKEALEMNWSDKLEAEQLDSMAGHLTRTSTNKQFYAGVALLQDHMSDPETWTKAAHEVIVQGEMERKSSAELRTLIKNLLTETSRDLRHHHDLVCRAFERNIEQMIAAKIELENQLKQLFRFAISQNIYQ